MTKKLNFKIVPKSTFDNLLIETGILVNKFDIENPEPPADEDIICATTGGITVSITPTYSDYGEDVDNMPNGMKEMKRLDSQECVLSTTAITTSPEVIALSIGAADIEEVDENITTIKPRRNLDYDKDFNDIWFLANLANDGMVAIVIKNALSNSGFSLQTTKNGKGQFSLELMGHFTLENQEEVPMQFYIGMPEADDTDSMGY